VSRRELGTVPVLLVAALFLTAFGNIAFFRNAQAVTAGAGASWVHMVSLALVVYCLLLVLLALLCSRKSIKPVLVVLFVLSALTAYFMDSYNVIIDGGMIANAAATDMAETWDLVTPRMLLYLFLLGIVPSALLLRISIRPQTFAGSLYSRLKLGASVCAAGFLLMVLSGSFYATLIREHKSVRFYTNPMTPLYGLYQYLKPVTADHAVQFAQIGKDAHISPTHPDRELIIMVVGEAARSDHFSLNGYPRQTNPRLEEIGVISFGRATSCGTSTSVSVPCMFAQEGRAEYADGSIEQKENALDVLVHAGVHVLWRDNNSTSKGVSERVLTEDYHGDPEGHGCDTECRDIEMLAGLQDFIDGQAAGDVLIVLHQMGSHGPAYYKRYPDKFRQFIPTCDSNQLDQCTREEIANTYDNTILYTDYFLSRVIGLLQANNDGFETALFYVSDHGESLGEFGLYLHGAPYVIAPEAQTHVPIIMWFGKNYDDVDRGAMRHLSSFPVSHDSVFQTLLGFFEVQSEVYRPETDLLQRSRELVTSSGGGNPVPGDLQVSGSD